MEVLNAVVKHLAASRGANSSTHSATSFCRRATLLLTETNSSNFSPVRLRLDGHPFHSPSGKNIPGLYARRRSFGKTIGMNVVTLPKLGSCLNALLLHNVQGLLCRRASELSDYNYAVWPSSSHLPLPSLFAIPPWPCRSCRLDPRQHWQFFSANQMTGHAHASMDERRSANAYSVCTHT